MRWTRPGRKTSDKGVDGEVVWYQCRRFEVPAEFAASSYQKLQIESGTGIFEIASALCFPKFVKSGAARVHELRKAGTRRLDAGVKFAEMIRARRWQESPVTGESAL